MYIIELSDNAKTRYYSGGYWDVVNKNEAKKFNTKKEAMEKAKELSYDYEDVKKYSWAKHMVKNGLDKKYICCKTKIITVAK